LDDVEPLLVDLVAAGANQIDDDRRWMCWRPGEDSFEDLA